MRVKFVRKENGRIIRMYYYERQDSNLWDKKNTMGKEFQ